MNECVCVSLGEKEIKMFIICFIRKKEKVNHHDRLQSVKRISKLPVIKVGLIIIKYLVVSPLSRNLRERRIQTFHIAYTINNHIH